MSLEELKEKILELEKDPQYLIKKQMYSSIASNITCEYGIPKSFLDSIIPSPSPYSGIISEIVDELICKDVLSK